MSSTSHPVNLSDTMASVYISLVGMMIIACCTDAAQIVSPAEETVSVTEGSDVQLVCHASPDEGEIFWSVSGMPVDPQSPSVDITTSTETGDDGQTVNVNTLVLHDISAAAAATYTCKPRDDVLNQDADEIQVVVSTAGLNRMRLVEAESSSTLELAEDGDLTIHCSGASRTQPVWYRNGEQLVENAQTVINVRVDATNSVKESILTRTSDVVGQYQCRDATGYQANSQVLTVTRAGN